MAENYTRRANTDFWERRIRRLIDEADVLRSPEIQSFADLLTYKDEIKRWVGRIYEGVSPIYNDRTIAASFRAQIDDIDLEEMMRNEAIDALGAIVAERVAGLEQLIEKTRQAEA